MCKKVPFFGIPLAFLYTTYMTSQIPLFNIAGGFFHKFLIYFCYKYSRENFVS